MLQKLRDKTTGWIATAVLGLLIIPFVFVGVSEYGSGRTDTTVAKVQAPPAWWSSAPSWWPISMFWEEEVVTLEEFRNRFEVVRGNERAARGEDFDPREFESLDNKLEVLQLLVDEKVLALAAKRADIHVSDEAVRQEIASEPAFQVEGKFDPDRYALMLSSQQPALTPARFQQEQRDRMQMALIPQAIGESEFVTPKELDRLIKLLGETRDVTIVALPPPEADGAPVTDAQIKAWYDRHLNQFQQPETVLLEYVDIDGSVIPASSEPVDEAALRQRYEQEKARFMSAEQRLASHILITVPPDVDAAVRAAAQKNAATLAGQARLPGADFAALAKANSQDPGSRDSGGDLGWVEQGAMVKPFEDALFSMQPGEVRGPVQTDFGYHVLQLREVKGGQGQSFEDVRAELMAEQAEVAAERAYNDVAGRVVNEVLKNPTAMGPAAESVGLRVQKAGPFSRMTAPGILGNPAVLRSAFSDAMIEDATVSDPIEIGPLRSVVIRVLEHTPEQAQPLAQVRDAVIQAIRDDRTAKAAEAAADALLARVRKGEDLMGIAKAQDWQSGELPGLPRGAPVPSPEINRSIFATERPAEGKVAAGKAPMDGGGYAVFLVTQVNEGDVKALEGDQRLQLQQQVMQMAGRSAVESFVGALRKKYRITLLEDRLR